MNKSDLKEIFEVRGKIEHVFFKDFMQAYAKPLGINQTHVITMMILFHEEKMTMSDLSYHLGLEKGSFTSVANRLIKDHYIKKEQSASDKRVYELSLDDKGLAFTKDFKQAHTAHIESRLNKLDDNKNFFELLSQLNVMLGQMLDEDAICMHHPRKKNNKS